MCVLLFTMSLILSKQKTQYRFLTNRLVIHMLIVDFTYSTDCCDKLFDHLNVLTEGSRRRVQIWPLQMMLLILCPVCFCVISMAITIMRSHAFSAKY